MVHIECTVDVLQCGTRSQRRGVHLCIVGFVHGPASGLQAVVGLKTIITGGILIAQLVNGKAVLLWCLKTCRCVFLYSHSGSRRFLLNLGLHLCLVILQALVKVSQLGRFRQVILALVKQRAAVLHIGHNSVVIGRLFRRNVLSLSQSGGSRLLHSGKIAMLFEVRDKLGQHHFPLCLVLLPCFRAFVMQNKILPVFIFGVVFVVVLDVLNQRTLSVTKILPSLVVVWLAVQGKINAECGLVVPATCVAVLFPFRVLGGVQFFKDAVCHGQRHGFAVLQLVTFTPQNCDRGLCGGVWNFNGCGNFIRFFCCLLERRQLITQHNFRHRGCLPQQVKCFLPGIRQGQTGCVQLAAVQSLIIRAIQGVVIAGITGLDEQGTAVVQCKCGFLYSGKVCFPLLAQFCQMFVQCRDQLMGRTSDNFQRGFQLGQFPARTPPGHITKGILGCVQPVVLADCISHAFGLHLAGAAVRAVGLFRVCGVDGVKFGVGNFMDSRLDGL